ncbi:MAG: hypothetical protein O7B26_00680 [Planctomycetota bacterium]|nr:hypothetical protein [Planctomycetota bacterium]
MNRSIRICALLVVASWATGTLAGGPSLQPKMGEPLADLTPFGLLLFEDGKTQFTRVFTAEEGLGPAFNKESCANCHNNPVGGSGTQTVVRFGIPGQKGGPFDPLESLGGSLLQKLSIDDDNCLEVVPDLPGIYQTTRITPSILGFGLAEAITDADLSANADPTDANSDGISGAVHMVQPLEDPLGPLRVGRFGWKAQVATLLTFSGGAGLNEMGITNDLVGTENAPNGDLDALAFCDQVADPEDTGPVGRRWIDKITDFQRFLAAPPQTPKSGMTGETVFNTMGCTACHITSFTTGPAPQAVLSGKVIKPYSDFLLHDMGLLFDGIPQGTAEEGEIRTPPLWGLRVRDPMLHDGTVAGGIDFADRVTQAIAAHGQSGSEAFESVDQFMNVISGADKAAVIAFLDSLGRAEFDMDGDGEVDGEDRVPFDACYSGPGSFYTPDDSCAISDLDEDGDVDCDDWQGFEAAYLRDVGVLPILSLTDMVNVLLGIETDALKKCVGDMDDNGANDGRDIGPYIDAVLAGA